MDQKAIALAAAKALDAKRGKDVSKYGFVARAQMALVKILPHGLVMDIWLSQQKL